MGVAGVLHGTGWVRVPGGISGAVQMDVALTIGDKALISVAGTIGAAGRMRGSGRISGPDERRNSAEPSWGRGRSMGAECSERGEP